MKILVFCVFLSFVCLISNVQADNLPSDLLEFVRLIPKRKVVRIGIDYMIFDREFREFYKYLQSDEFGMAWNEIVKLPDVTEFLNFLQKEGFKTTSILNRIADYLGLNKRNQERGEIKQLIRRRTGGLRGFIKDVLDALPLDRMDELFDRKMRESDEFRRLINKIATINYDAIKEHINKSEALSAVARTLKKYHIEVDTIIDGFAEIFVTYKTPTEARVISDALKSAIPK